MNAGRTYRRPPVTEAAIELRYESAVSQSILEKAAARLGKVYPISEEEFVQSVNVDVQTGKAWVAKAWQGVKRSSADRTEVVMFRTGTLVIGHLAPHKGWEHLLDKTKDACRALARVTGENLSLSRVGIRYINRIDIPNGSKESNIFDYIHFRPQIPGDLVDYTVMTEYFSQIAYPIKGTGLNARIIVGRVLSPLIAHTSIVFDIDVFQDHSITRKTEAVWGLLSEMRDQKNLIFETGITDKARELFDR
jgi:uncharacterized protein (TIGR04255 family)